MTADDTGPRASMANQCDRTVSWCRQTVGLRRQPITGTLRARVLAVSAGLRTSHNWPAQRLALKMNCVGV